MRHRVTLGGFERMLSHLTPELEKAIARGLRSAGQRLVGMVVEEIDTAKPYPAVDRGQLRRSVRESEILEFGKPVGSHVYMDAPHAAIIEEGTRPFWPPMEPILEWVIRKRLASGDDAVDVANAVRVAISKRGIKPRRYFAKAVRRLGTDGVVVNELKHELDLVARKP